MAFVAALLLLAPAVAHALWTEQVTVPAATVQSANLVTPVLGCTQGLLGSSVTITWPVQTQPTTPSYAASVQSVTLPAPTISNGQASVAITGSLLSSLIAGTKTVSVVASLPGTSWTSPAGTRTISFVLIGLFVYC